MHSLGAAAIVRNLVAEMVGQFLDGLHNGDIWRILAPSGLNTQDRSVHSIDGHLLCSC